MNKQIIIWWPGFIYQIFLFFLNFMIGLIIIITTFPDILRIISQRGRIWWNNVNNRLVKATQNLYNNIGFYAKVLLPFFSINKRYLKIKNES